jgi:hypothetical protein
MPDMMLFKKRNVNFEKSKKYTIAELTANKKVEISENLSLSRGNG